MLTSHSYRLIVIRGRLMSRRLSNKSRSSIAMTLRQLRVKGKRIFLTVRPQVLQPCLTSSLRGANPLQVEHDSLADSSDKDTVGGPLGYEPPVPRMSSLFALNSRSYLLQKSFLITTISLHTFYNLSPITSYPLGLIRHCWIEIEIQCLPYIMLNS